MLYAGISDEVPEKDISGKYMTPYEYVNSTLEEKPAGNPVLAKELWEESLDFCKEHVLEMKVRGDLLS